MSEMVERVARTICESLNACGQNLKGRRMDYDDPWICGPLLVVARAAIAAMREPTDAMADVGRGVDAWDDFLTDAGRRKAPKRVWRAMIDEALR